ncbi:MAG TPA: hypothetical protein PLL71_15075 [Agriterribacter sp.]|nr:hypothetical protein [Agriterribacter sp.]HRQ51790.1 hypothetical protein [Agriterribacter sp.]
MDTRITLDSKETFFTILKELHVAGTKASLLYDDNGLTRYEGLIRGVTGAPVSVLLLQEGVEIPLSSVIAVNGIFAPDYSEC